MIVETQDRNKARADHKGLIEDFEKLKQTPGWQRMKQYLDDEAGRVFAVLSNGQSGDVLIKAAGAFAVLKNIASLPYREVQASLDRLAQMDEEDKQEGEYRKTLRTHRNQP